MRMKRGFVKNSSENAPWSERSAALHAGAIKPEQGFCGSVLDSSRASVAGSSGQG